MKEILDDQEETNLDDSKIYNLVFSHTLFVFLAFIAIYYFRKYIHDGIFTIQDVEISTLGIVILVIIFSTPKRLATAANNLNNKQSIIKITLLAGLSIFLGSFIYKLILTFGILKNPIHFSLGIDIIKASCFGLIAALFANARVRKLRKKSTLLPNLAIAALLVMAVIFANKL